MSQEGTLTMDEYKTCSKCRQIKHNTEYYADKRSSTGLQSQCKKCIWEWRNANKEKLRAQKIAYRSIPEVRRREIAYALEYQAKHPEVVKRSREKEKLKDPLAKKERFRVWAQNNPERIKANRARARAKNPALYRSYSFERRGLLKSTKNFSITKKELARLYYLPCFYCGGPGGTIDHVIPLKKGGIHGIGNLVPCCQSCNSSKRDKFVMEWRLAKAHER
jgi:5-methylcytosine-specific restriction endonuclease McrA